MKSPDLLSKIKQLIALDEIHEAIALIRNLLNSSPKLDEIIIQSARFNRVVSMVKLGTVGFEESNIAKNNIIKSILDLINDIEENIKTSEDIEKEVREFVRCDSKVSIQQIHYGKGDIIAGNKNITINNK